MDLPVSRRHSFCQPGLLQSASGEEIPGVSVTHPQARPCPWCPLLNLQVQQSVRNRGLNCPGPHRLFPTVKDAALQDLWCGICRSETTDTEALWVQRAKEMSHAGFELSGERVGAPKPRILQGSAAWQRDLGFQILTSTRMSLTKRPQWVESWPAFHALLQLGCSRPDWLAFPLSDWLGKSLHLHPLAQSQPRNVQKILGHFLDGLKFTPVFCPQIRSMSKQQGMNSLLANRCLWRYLKNLQSKLHANCFQLRLPNDTQVLTNSLRALSASLLLLYRSFFLNY